MAKHTMVDTLDEKEILAQRAECDVHGRKFPDTYATFDYVNRKSYADFRTSIYGKILADELGVPILDEKGGFIYNEDAAELWTSFRERGFGAERAIADENGNVIDTTYATKAEVAEVIAKIGSIADGGTLTDGATVNVINNAVSKLTTAQSTLTLNVNLAPGEVANFAVEVNTTANATLTVTSTSGSAITTLRQSIAGGTSLESGKHYQVTCVGTCWTLAEFA